MNLIAKLSSVRIILHKLISYILVQFALSNFLSTEDEKDSKLLRWFKFCLQQQYILYFDQKMAQHQKNNSLVGYKLANLNI